MLVQGDRKIMPVRIRADDTADRTSAWPKSPAYRAKVVASFTYGDFDPLAKTQLSVFPRTGGGISFDLDFAAVPQRPFPLLWVADVCNFLRSEETRLISGAGQVWLHPSGAFFTLALLY